MEDLTQTIRYAVRKFVELNEGGRSRIVREIDDLVVMPHFRGEERRLLRNVWELLDRHRT